MWLSYNQVIKVGITILKGKTPDRLIQERDVKEALGTEIGMVGQELWASTQSQGTEGPFPTAFKGESQTTPDLKFQSQNCQNQCLIFKSSRHSTC